MPTLPNGQFSYVIESKDLARGLRPVRSVPRNTKFLYSCLGMVGKDGTLQTIPDLSETIDISTLDKQEFPYPQLFVFPNVIILATRAIIYELINGSLEPVFDLTGSEGSYWSAISIGEFVLMSNNVITLIRSATSLTWEVKSDLPSFNAICNYNGQIFIGAPNESV